MSPESNACAPLGSIASPDCFARFGLSVTVWVISDVFRHSTASPAATVTWAGLKLVKPKSTDAAAFDNGPCAGPPSPQPERDKTNSGPTMIPAALLALFRTDLLPSPRVQIHRLGLRRRSHRRERGAIGDGFDLWNMPARCDISSLRIKKLYRRPALLVRVRRAQPAARWLFPSNPRSTMFAPRVRAPRSGAWWGA